MSNGAYIGVNGAARKVASMYVGVDGVARKVTKGYIGVDGLVRQFYGAAQPFSYAYTGDCTESEATIDGVAYTVLTITSSGTLSVTRAISADVWLCGGGANGKMYSKSSIASYAGGGGGGGYANNGTLAIEASLAITVPSAGGIANCGNINANPGSSDTSGAANRGTDGGSGGGEGGSNSSSGGVGKGAGTSTIPTQFGSTQAHCAGGAGGSYLRSFRYGGNGGSNGSDGDGQTRTAANGRKGGAVGGGNENSSATFYGGGGGGANCTSDESAFAGKGYQGVVYIRWKKEDAA